MSSTAKRVNKQIQNQRLHTVVQCLMLMEEQAKKKNIFQRVWIATRYVFCKDFKGFFTD